MYEAYYLPKTISEALNCLGELKGTGKVISGGTDIMIALKEKTLMVKGLVDVTRIEDLRKLALEDEDLVIGAAVTHHELDYSGLVRGRATALAEAAHAVGSQQIRRLATVGGNVVNAQPAADTAVALAALGAVAEIHGMDGVRTPGLADLYRRLNVSAVDSGKEVVVCFRIKAHGPGEGSAFERLQLRKALSLPVINSAVFISLRDGTIDRARIVVAPVDFRPLQITEAEQILMGAKAGPRVIREAAEAAAQVSKPRDSKLRGSSEYRKAMVKVMVQRAIEKAVERARRF